MKVLLYNDTYQHLGGAETYCLELMSKLEELGHQPFWMAHGNSSPVRGNHIVLPHFNEGKFKYFQSKYFFNTKAYQAIKKQLEQLQPDVIHLHHNRYYTFSVMKAIQDTQVPVIQTIHDYTLLCPSQYYPDLYYDTPGTKSRKENCQLICSQGTCLPLKSRLGHPFAHDRKRKKIIHKIPAFIAPSTQLKLYLEKAGFKNVHYIPFFIDEKKWSFNTQREMKNVVLFVGRVETNKGIYYLIDAIVNLRQKIPDIQLIIAGDGSELGNIQKKIKENNWQEFITTKGFVDYSNIDECYNNANVLVVPSLDMEQFGLIGIEGLASGIAVIGSDAGGIPEWCVDEKTGLLFNPEHPEELKGKIKRILLEKGLADKLTQAGIEQVKKIYEEKQHMDKLMELYRNTDVIR